MQEATATITTSAELPLSVYDLALQVAALDGRSAMLGTERHHATLAGGQF